MGHQVITSRPWSSFIDIRTKGFPGGSDSKELICNVGNLGSIHGLGRSTGGGHGNPLQYSCLENPHGPRSLGGYSPWGPKASDTTKQQSTWLCSLHSGNDQHPSVRTSEQGADVRYTCVYCLCARPCARHALCLPILIFPFCRQEN